jgi:S-formylglutathione hydrolase
MKQVSSFKSFGGTLSVWDHASSVCACDMRFGVYAPPGAGPSHKVPVLWYLSGLTCTWANVMEKAGLQRVAAELGIMVVAPDTSPRGESVPNDAAYDLGQGASFYLSATQAPWSTHFRMDTYLLEELPGLIQGLGGDLERQGITGHSMGGLGALHLHLNNPERFQSVSAFSPIVAPSQVPWGRKAFGAYLGQDQAAWQPYDPCALVRARPSKAHVLIDQGLGDSFLKEQLRPELFEEACAASGQQLTLRRHEGYDHSYYFIASFAEDHLRHHAKTLGG